MSQVKKIIVDSRYFVNNAPAGKGTFELAEIVEIHGSQVLYLESFNAHILGLLSTTPTAICT